MSTQGDASLNDRKLTVQPATDSVPTTVTSDSAPCTATSDSAPCTATSDYVPSSVTSDPCPSSVSSDTTPPAPSAAPMVNILQSSTPSVILRPKSAPALRVGGRRVITADKHRSVAAATDLSAWMFDREE